MQDNNVPVSRHWLESLSTDELIKLADTYGVDIPPGLERIFIIEELLEITSLDKQEATETIVVNPSYSETALLPKQYNISYIEVIIRDPLWVFVFWEIKGHDREIHENAGNFNGYFLRVIPLDENGKEQKSTDNLFTVPVNPDDNARYLGFAGDASHYVIKLGVIRGDSELPIVSSAPFYLPHLIEDDDIAKMGSKSLMRFSGVQDLATTKKTDRQSRIKRHL